MSRKKQHDCPAKEPDIVKKNESLNKQASELRKRAEWMGNDTPIPADYVILSKNDESRLVHELRVHQIQLESQNEELRQSHIDLEASRLLYYELYDLAPVGYVSLNEKGIILRSNLTAAKLLGIDRGILNKQPLQRFIHIDDWNIYDRMLEKLIGTDTPQDYEMRMLNHDQTPFWVNMKAVANSDTNKTPVYRVVISNIDDRKQLENEIRKNNEKLQMLFKLLPVGLSVTDREGNSIVTNPAMKKILDMTGPEFQEKSAEPRSFLRSDGSFLPVNEFPGTRAARERAPVNNIEIGVHKDDGMISWVNITSVPTSFDDWEIITTITDITGRRQAEDSIRKLLADKQVLLEEVHHRVKNNMLTIYSLVTLQMNELKEPSAVQALRDTASRVSSMMILYDKLNHFRCYNEIAANDYLPSLADDIIFSFPNSRSVKIEKHIDDFKVTEKKILPLGLIVNELLTNIMKYAFQGRDKGVITISASRSDKITIMIQDNGIGIPAKTGIDSSSGFGLSIVGALVKQLDGSIQIERLNGTKFILEFPA